MAKTELTIHEVKDRNGKVYAAHFTVPIEFYYKFELIKQSVNKILNEPTKEKWESKAYDTFLPTCSCKNGVLIKDGEIYCRWCRAKYDKAANINYCDEHFPLNDEQPKEEKPKLSQDEFYQAFFKEPTQFQPQSGEFVTLEECNRRERNAFVAGRSQEYGTEAYPRHVYDTFDQYKKYPNELKNNP